MSTRESVYLYEHVDCIVVLMTFFPYLHDPCGYVFVIYMFICVLVLYYVVWFIIKYYFGNLVQLQQFTLKLLYYDSRNDIVKFEYKL